MEAFQIIMKEGESFMMFYSMPYSGGVRKGVATKNEDKATNLKLNCPMLDIKLHFTNFNLNLVVDILK